MELTRNIRGNSGVRYSGLFNLYINRNLFTSLLMSKMPLPPGHTINRGEQVTESGSTSPVTRKLTEDETEFILQSTLMPHHQTDPNVIGFIRSYLICRDAKQAANSVGLVAAAGRNLLARADIHDAIRQITAKATRKYGYDAEELVERVKEIANVDPVEIENPDGTYKKRWSELSPEFRRAVKKLKVKNLYSEDINGIKVHCGEIIEWEFHDKMKGIELLSREKGVFKETKVVEHGVTKDMKSILLGSLARGTEAANTIREATSVQVSALIDVTPTPKKENSSDHSSDQ